MRSLSVLMATVSPLPLAAAGCLNPPPYLMIDGKRVAVDDADALRDQVTGGESFQLKGFDIDAAHAAEKAAYDFDGDHG